MKKKRVSIPHVAECRASGLREDQSGRVPSLEELEPRILCSHTLIIGHRGNSGVAPENTLVSLDQAFARAADVVEADIHYSADGVPVLMHDWMVDRTTDGSGEVAGLTVDQLKQLDAGSWKSPEFAGEKVPTVAEALLKAAGRGPIYLDQKVEGLGAPIKQILMELGLPDTAVWAAANTQTLVTDIHQHLPGTPILWWGPVPTRATSAYFQSMRDLGVSGFDLHWGEFSRRFFHAARNNGMFFSTYTVNRPADLRAAMRLDLDAIETDFPGQLAGLIAGPTDRVSAELIDGRLVVEGDRFDNHIRIEGGTHPDSLRIVGMRGTLINGQISPLEFDAVRELQISLSNGDDDVRLVDLVLNGSIHLDSGRGNDHVTANRARFTSDVALITGSGSDWVKVEESIFDRLLIEGGLGVDILDAGLLTTVNARDNSFQSAPVLHTVESLVT